MSDVYSWPYLMDIVSHKLGGSDEISEGRETKEN